MGIKNVSAGESLSLLSFFYGNCKYGIKIDLTGVEDIKVRNKR